MLNNNPFLQLADLVPSLLIKIFVIIMFVLVILGTLIDIIHKKNVKYFFLNAKKAKKSASKVLNVSEKISVISKTIATDILTTSELGAGQRRIAHLLGMYGTIIFWITSVVMIFGFTNNLSNTPYLYTAFWHLGAIMTCVGGFWFWFFLRVDVYSEAYPWYRIIRADLFVLSLVITAAFALLWSLFQTAEIILLEMLFLILYVLSNIILFGGVYWSKFAHMFYKPGAALQKNLAEADGSRDNMPLPAEAPEQFGLGIKREKPKHY